MPHKLMGKKRGMMQLFDETGNAIVCTVIEAEPNIITQIKTKTTDGYNAIQFGFEKVKVKDPRTMETRVSSPLRGHYKKAGIEPRRFLSEIRVENTDEYTIGQELGVSQFATIAYVDVCAISKGKGFQGVMKKNNFAGGPATHGSGFHRHAGSTGQRSTPGRCLPGVPHASQMGLEKVTTQNLEVVRVDEEANIIIVKGAVPGPRNGLVYITQAIKIAAEKKFEIRSFGVKLWLH